MLRDKQQIKKYLKTAIQQIDPVDEKEIQDKKRIKNFLALHPHNFYDRKNLKGHITASGIVFNQVKILLMRHPKLNIWLQPGGHCREEEMPYEAARRKIGENTGLNKIKIRQTEQYDQPMPFYCAVYKMPSNEEEKEHLHLDLLYLFDAEKTEEELINQLPKNFQWFDKKTAAEQNETIKKVLLKLAGKIII